MNSQITNFWKKLHGWRLRHVTDRQLILFLSVLIGITTGFAAVVIKYSVHFIREFVVHGAPADYHRYLYFIFPVIGIMLAVLFSRYIIRRPVRHGVPNVLYAISQSKGFMRAHNMFSSVVTSALTVGFGGSVGLEGPTVSTGAAIGSFIGRIFRLRYRQVVLLLGCACAGAMSAIFKAPIAGIVFALEVIMLDLTLSSLVPLLTASASAVVTSYFFTGQDVLYPFEVKDGFVMEDLLFYVLLGVGCGIVSVYFKKVYVYFEGLFERFDSPWKRILFGGLALGLILVLFPALYGEGYEVINSCLEGDFSYLFRNTWFSSFEGNFGVTLLLLGALVLMKVVAASLTFGSGGVGGIFAPTLFMGANWGLLFALGVNAFGGHMINENNFALIGMGGMISGVLHAPLTGMFLIADISGGYHLFLPLMLVATVSFVTVRVFERYSVYTHQLAKRNELITHDKDKAVLSMMAVSQLIESDFYVLSTEAKLKDLVEGISKNHRNLFPVVDAEGLLHGMVKMDDVRHLIFKSELYDTVLIKDLMYMPKYYISPDDAMSDVADKFHTSGRFNLAVLDHGKYIGFISRARVFSVYREQVRTYTSEW